MSLAYFPLFPDDFEADTAHLTLAEDGAYNRLLRLCWRTPGCSVPADRAWVYRRLRAHSEEDRAVVDTVLEEFFTVTDGRLSNARLKREWLAANDAHKKRVSAGSKGGKSKRLKTNEKKPSNAQAMPEQCSSNQNQNQNQSIKEGGGGSAGAREAENPPPENPTFRERILTAMGVDPCGLTGRGGQTLGQNADMAHAMRWLDLPGLTEDLVVAEIESLMQRKRDGPPSTFSYFNKAMARLSGALTAPPLDPAPPTRTGGPQNDRARFDIAHREYVRRLAAGEIQRGPDPSDPFAGR